MDRPHPRSAQMLFVLALIAAFVAGGAWSSRDDAVSSANAAGGSADETAASAPVIAPVGFRISGPPVTGRTSPSAAEARRAKQEEIARTNGRRAQPGRADATTESAVTPGVSPGVRLADEVSVGFGPLTEDEIERCLLVAGDLDPSLESALRSLRGSDPDAFRSRLERSKRLRSFARLMRDEPHLYDKKLLELRTDQKVLELTKRLEEAVRVGETAAINRLRGELLFSMRLQQAFVLESRRQYINRLRERVEELEEQFAFDLANVDREITQRVASIIEDAGADADPSP